tara:strand:- start:300 stop:407 length:108 start_codon:yes stop_codon:yes gene_type:complete
MFHFYFTASGLKRKADLNQYGGVGFVGIYYLFTDG